MDTTGITESNYGLGECDADQFYQNLDIVNAIVFDPWLWDEAIGVNWTEIVTTNRKKLVKWKADWVYEVVIYAMTYMRKNK